MATLYIKSLLDQKKREFYTAGQANDRFEMDFLDAVNRAIRRINLFADLETAMDAVADLDDTVSVYSMDFEPIISDLVSDELMRMGQHPAKGVVARDPLELRHAINMLRQRILQDKADADTDDDTSDQIGLGHLA